MGIISIISIIVACLSVIAGVFSLLIIPKFSEMFSNMSVAIPIFTEIMLDSSGWIPGGIFFVAAAMLLALAVMKKHKVAGTVAIVTFVTILVTAVVVPYLLYSSLSIAIRQIEGTNETKKQNKSEMATPNPPPHEF